MSDPKKRPPGKIAMPVPAEPPTLDLDDKCIIKLNESSPEIEVRAVDLVLLENLGSGAYGDVDKMQHGPSGLIMAVKMVRFYGAMFREGDVWLCMEVMDISMDRFYKRTFANNVKMPEYFIAKLALAVVEGLNFMKEQMNLMHRDVKPSNILLNDQGAIKLCDYGISGPLTNSIAKTVNAGCKPYMPPERIDGDAKMAYDVRADVWSLGITLVEVATGKYPYNRWKSPFEQLKQVTLEPAPKLPEGHFSPEMNHFVNRCLEKNYLERPKYAELLANPFLEKARTRNPDFNMSSFVKSVLTLSDPPQRRS